MSEALLDRVDGFINEEKWTRSALSNYTVSQFKELEDVLEEARNDEVRQELKKHCQDSLTSSKGSLVAQYLVGILTWQDNQLEDGVIGSLLSLFENQNKWSIIEYLCQKMLETVENKMALTYLVRAYEHQRKDQLYYETLERLSRIDYEDADLALTLANYYEQQGKKDEGLAFYKKAIYRLITRKQFNSIQQVWQKLLKYGVENEDLYTSIFLKVEKIMGLQSASELKKSLYRIMREAGRTESCINLLKDILEVNVKDSGMRKELVECYREKYKDHSRLEECVQISDITHGFRNVQEAIKLFEKHISLDAGRFVFHRVYGVGKIQSLNQDQVLINFSKKRGHTMGLEMAVNSLTSLPDKHIWVLRSIMPREKLKEKIRTDIPWALRMLARSFGGRVDLKKIKAELSPIGQVRTLLTPNEWSDFSQKARQIVKMDSSFGKDQNHADVYILRTTPVSYEEKLSSSFRSEENFFRRLQIMQEFVSSADLSSEFFADMVNYFLGYLKLPQINEHVVASYILIQNLSKVNIGISAPSMSFLEFFENIQNPELVFVRLDNVECQHGFLVQIKENLQNWKEIYLLFLAYVPQRMIIDELLEIGIFEEVKTVFKGVMIHYRTNPYPFFWLISYLRETGKYEQLGVDEDRIYFAVLHLVDISSRNIANRKDLVSNKRTLRQAMTIFFKGSHLSSYLSRCSREMAVRLCSLLRDIKNLDSIHRAFICEALYKRFPELAVEDSEDDRLKAMDVVKNYRHGTIWTTTRSFNDKNARLKLLIEVEIPKNSLEIGEAIKRGDLKENAEYIFGKERQEQLQLEVKRLQKDLEACRVFSDKNIDRNVVGFGVTVTLRDLLTEKREVYTFLGPWESDPDAHVISYMAPFAEPMLGKKVGDIVKFTINDRGYEYAIEQIEFVNFSEEE